jgi:ABC-type multidrug transport system permease subunit
MVGHQQSIAMLHQDRLVFYRERSANAVGTIAYWFSTFIIQIPLTVINIVIFCAIEYYLAGLKKTASAFGLFVYIMVFSSLCGLFVCYFVSAISPTIQVALNFFPLVLFFTVAFAGFIINLPQFPPWLGTWAPYLSFMRYSLQALALNEFEDNNKLPLGSRYLATLGFDTLQLPQITSIIFLFIAFYALIFLLALAHISFEKR